MSDKKYVYLIGDPIEHSISPQMHNAAYKELSLNYEYKLLKTTLAELPKTIEKLKNPSTAGFNVTIPHKENVIKYLDYVDNSAQIIGAVNSVKNDNGILKGFNTDAIGFIESLTRDANFDPKNKKILLIGAGGAAKAVAVALCKEMCQEISIYDIDTNKAKILVQSLSEKFSDIKISLIDSKHKINQVLINSDCIINATPIGMHPKDDSSPIDDDAPFREGQVVYDLVYNPPITKLMKIASQKGTKTFSGLGMLVRQGAAAFELFTEQVPSIKTMWNAAEEALGLEKTLFV